MYEPLGADVPRVTAPSSRTNKETDLTTPPSDTSGVGQRLALDALEYEVPARANKLDFMLGALTAVALTLLAVTGIVLTQYYNPAPIGAHASVRYILTNTPLVGYLRDMHVWSASAGLLLVFTHLSAVFWRRGFRKPREGLWWSGVLLLLLLFALTFTGSVLRGDQEAVEALSHATAGAALVGPIGAPLSPDLTPSSPLLTRMYGLHVSVLPLLLFGIVALHFWLVRHLGVSAGGEQRALFTKHLVPLSGFSLLLVGVVALLAMVSPAELLAPGVDGFEVTKPLWAFLWIYAAENFFGMTGMLIAPAVLFGFLFLVPLLDRNEDGMSRVTRIVGVVLLAVIVISIVYAAVAPAQEHLM